MQKYFISIFLIVTISSGWSQSSDTLLVAFWNLQNLFDTIDDPIKDDEEFLSSSELEWNEERLEKKMFNMSRVIRLMNNGNGPDILGVCEVEHQSVLDSMVQKYLSDLNYKTAYIESPDNRGIDNGLVYKADKFKLLNIQADTIHLSSGYPTRLIFGVNLLTMNNEKITVFVNHWPSRRGGQDESEQHRIMAALTLRNAVDRIFNTDPDSKIFIIGDFNDEPHNISLSESLRAQRIICDSINTKPDTGFKNELFNLSFEAHEKGDGSYKYQDNWNMLDQIIVSGSLIIENNFYYLCKSFEVYKPELIVTRSGKYKGAPYPTYGGKNYLAGFSDHFPVIAKFVWTRQ